MNPLENCDLFCLISKYEDSKAASKRLLLYISDNERLHSNHYAIKIRWVVLDEVDRLLDMGFEQTILEILSTIRGVRLPGLKDREVLKSMPMNLYCCTHDCFCI
jgi:hypothetical protein